MRALRLSVLTPRQRRIALHSTILSSTLLVYSTWRSQRPVLADSNHLSVQWQPNPDIDRVIRRQSNLSENTSRSNARSSGRGAGSAQSKHDDSATGEGGGEHDAKESAWEKAATQLGALGTATTTSTFPASLGIISNILPSWATAIPTWIDKLKNELSMAPWSLSWEIWEEAHDPEINPEILWDAQVRMSKNLCKEEQAFLQHRQLHTAKALAKYLGVPEVHPDDVPIIAMCGSGGGLRALVAGAASHLSAQEDGLFDCVTYTAGVSGSCWLQTLYNSSIGQQDYGHIINHLKQRLDVHIAHPSPLLGLLTQSPTNKYLLSGFVEKLRGVPDADFGLVDVYGVALAARLLVPRGELRISDWDLKVSNQRYYTDKGYNPLPIYTAVRHEIPEKVEDMAKLAKDARFTTKHYDWFQWFEWTPYEFFTEELDAGIPSWAVGRRWVDGRTEWRDNGLALPELRIPLYLGIWGSAFCATLSHYYKEVRPVLKTAGFGIVDTFLSDKKAELVKVHPIDAAVIPNFARGLGDRVNDVSTTSLHTATHLALMDAGMANNLPIYPLLRPDRKVDVIIAFDASADVRGDNWIKVVDGYAQQRGIKGWPMGAGWPPSSNSEDETVEEMEDAQQIAGEQSDGHMLTKSNPISDLGHCTVWVGTKESQEYMDAPVPHRIQSEDDDATLRKSDAGVALIYFPFMANDKVKDVDPQKEDFMSTWNFVYTPEDIDKVVSLARANYDEGREQTRRTIRAVWERKREQRLEKEEQARAYARRMRMQRGVAAAMRRNGDHGQGDQFGGGV